MTLILDAGGLFAQADVNDPAHEAAVSLLKGEPGPLINFLAVSPLYGAAFELLP
jgi:predicted nucleic acid-binding protein